MDSQGKQDETGAKHLKLSRTLAVAQGRRVPKKIEKKQSNKEQTRSRDAQGGKDNAMTKEGLNAIMNEANPGEDITKVGKVA